MIIIDDFLNETDFATILDIAKAARDTPEIQDKGRDYQDEPDHVNFDQSHFWYLQGTDKIIINELVKRDFFESLALRQGIPLVRYHLTKYPYASVWHCDRSTDWDSEEIDYLGMTLFLNDWDSNNGGLYIYKDTKESDTGYFVAPKKNRLILNPKDYYHGVTQIRVKDVERHSLQMFISSRYCKV